MAIGLLGLQLSRAPLRNLAATDSRMPRSRLELTWKKHVNVVGDPPRLILRDYEGGAAQNPCKCFMLQYMRCTFRGSV